MCRGCVRIVRERRGVKVWCVTLRNETNDAAKSGTIWEWVSFGRHKMHATTTKGGGRDVS